MASDQQDQGLQARLVIDRDTASRLGITPQAIDDTLYDAFGQRQVSTMFTQLNQYRVVLEVEAGVPAETRETCKTSTCAPRDGGQVPLSAFTQLETTDAPLAINHQGQFPAVTLSFNLAPGASLGEAVAAIDRAQAGARPAGEHPSQLPGHGAGVPGLAGQRAAADPGRAGHGLHRARRALRELHPPAHDPLHAAVGGRRRAARALLLCRTEFSVIALIGIILLIGIVKKNAIMMIDFALRPSAARARRPRRRSTRPACCASGRS